MADRWVTAATVSTETTEKTDSIDITDTTANTAMLNSVVADTSLPTSHSAQKDNSNRKRDIGCDQELSSTRPWEVISGEDANLTVTDAQTTEQSGTEMGSAEITQNLQRVGYKREHSDSPCSQTSPLPSPTSVCRAIGCVVEPEQELVVNGEATQGGQREERQPRKRMKCEEMEGGGESGGGSGRK